VIGKASSTAGTGVHGKAQASSGDTHGVRGESASPDGKGVSGTAPLWGVHGTADHDDGTGVYGEVTGSGTARGVWGKALASAGTTYGVYGTSNSSSGMGVYGQAPLYGVQGRSDNPTGTGVYGEANGSDTARGVWGTAKANTGTTYGVYGTSNSSSGMGVYGQAPRYGVQGRSDNDTGIGVYGRAGSSGTGVLGQSNTGVGVLACKTFNTGDILQAMLWSEIRFRVEHDGDVYADGSFHSGGADYAEWLPRLDSDEDFRPGEVVGVFAGRISHRTHGASAILVISSNPAMIGNAESAESEAREGHEIVAFLGQAPVRVRGPVQVGEVLLASQAEDGTAVAISPDELGPDELLRVVGTSWESAEGPGPNLVNACIGVDRLQLAARSMATLRSRHDQLLERVERLERLVATESGGSRSIGRR
jgi:hypothetical protein